MMLRDEVGLQCSDVTGGNGRASDDQFRKVARETNEAVCPRAEVHGLSAILAGALVEAAAQGARSAGGAVKVAADRVASLGRHHDVRRADGGSGCGRKRCSSCAV